MKKITLLMSLLLAISTHAQQPYSLPFTETFSTVVNGASYDETSLNNVLATKGWIYAEPTSTAGVSRISFKTLGEGGYMFTPELSVSSGSALEINFVARMFKNDIGSDAATKKTNNLHRNFYAVIGNDTVYDHQKLSYDMANPLMQNLNRFMGTYIYDGTSPIKIKFFSTNTYQSVWGETANINQDGMTLGNNTAAGNNTGMWILTRSGEQDTIPALNIAYGENIDLGLIDGSINAPGSVLSKNFMFKAKNLQNAATFNDDASVSLKLDSKDYTPISGIINENVGLKITVPASNGTYIEKVTLVADGDRANGATNTAKMPTRTIWFTYRVSNISTSINNVNINNMKVVTENGKMRITSDKIEEIEVLNLLGVRIAKFVSNQTEMTIAKGAYLVRSAQYSTKVLVR